MDSTTLIKELTQIQRESLLTYKSHLAKCQRLMNGEGTRFWSQYVAITEEMASGKCSEEDFIRLMGVSTFYDLHTPESVKVNLSEGFWVSLKKLYVETISDARFKASHWEGLLSQNWVMSEYVAHFLRIVLRQVVASRLDKSPLDCEIIRFAVKLAGVEAIAWVPRARSMLKQGRTNDTLAYHTPKKRLMLCGVLYQHTADGELVEVSESTLALERLFAGAPA